MEEIPNLPVDFQKEKLPAEQEKWIYLQKELNGFWTLNWEKILSTMQELNLDDAKRSELAQLTIKYIQGSFEHGQFGNLEGIEPVIQFLGIDNIEFTPTQQAEIVSLYDKYSLSFLYGMSPTLYDGKLRGGETYDRVEYVRQMLKKNGASDEELTDEYIKNLWRLREVLVKMRQMRYDPKKGSLLQPNQKLIQFIRQFENKK